MDGAPRTPGKLSPRRLPGGRALCLLLLLPSPWRSPAASFESVQGLAPDPAVVPARSAAQNASQDTARRADRGDYLLPPVEVDASRMTLAELIEWAARAAERAHQADIPHRYTAHMRWVVLYGDSTEPGRKRQIYDEVSRVEVGEGRIRRTVRLSRRLETYRGDSLLSIQTDDEGTERTGAQVQQFRDLPFAVRGEEYEYQVLERRPLRDRALLRIRYAPRERYASHPEGEAWLDTRDYMVRRQTGCWLRNLPLPMIIRRIEALRLVRNRYGPLWMEDDYMVRVRLRLARMGGPELLEMRVRLYDIQFADLPDVYVSALDLKGPGDREEQAILDSLATADTLHAASALFAPPVVDLGRAALRGDSLLRDLPQARSWLYPSFMPEIRYDRVQRLYVGARTDLALWGPPRRSWRTGPPARPWSTLRLAGGYASALERFVGRSELGLGSGLVDGSWRWGALLGAGDGITVVGTAPSLFQGLLAVVAGSDPHDYYRVRGVEVSPWLRRGENLRVELSARSEEHLGLRPRSFWSIFRGQVRARELMAIDPGRVQSVRGEIRLGGDLARHERTLTLRETLAGGGLGGDFAYNAFGAELTTRPLLPGGRRFVLRTQFLHAEGGLPRQERLDLGGSFTLRGYAQHTLSGRSGYHVGGELYLNMDALGWLPWPPGGGGETFAAFDHGGILSDAWLEGRPVSGRPVRTSAGLGFARHLGLPGARRLMVGLHAGLGPGDRAWALRLNLQ